MPKPMKQRLFQAYRALRGAEAPKTSKREIRREIPPISEEEVAEAKSFFPLDKFFIFGHARSGTTMLARLIRLHPEVHCNYQAHFFTRAPLLESLVADEEVGDWLKRDSNRWNHGKDLSPVVLRVVADYILEREARLEGKRIVGDKSPSSLLDGAVGAPDAQGLSGCAPDLHRPRWARYRDLAPFSGLHRLPSASFERRSAISELILPRRPSRSWPASARSSPSRACGGPPRAGCAMSARPNSWASSCTASATSPCATKTCWNSPGKRWGGCGISWAQSRQTPSCNQALMAEMAQNPDADWQQQKAKEIAQPLQGSQGQARHLARNLHRPRTGRFSTGSPPICCEPGATRWMTRHGKQE